MMLSKFLPLFALSVLFVCDGFAQAKKEAPNKKPAAGAFRWNNESKKSLPAGVTHSTFRSSSMGIDVGYCIYLPPGYAAGGERHYPVVYHLHGGRPGSELKAVQLAEFVDAAIRAGEIEPTIYVFPNGGPMSWYNYPQKENGLGEDVLVKELIPHIDKTYRSIGKRAGRGIEGFSQGGRGTTRIMFRYPELFVSAAPGGSGYEPEKRIQENGGSESAAIKFAGGDNTWDLAKKFAGRNAPGRPDLKILLWVGTEGFNYEYNLKFSAYLSELGIEHGKLVQAGATHSAKMIYEKRGLELMRFHQQAFAGK